MSSIPLTRYSVLIGRSSSPEHDLAKTSHLVMWVSYTYSEKTGVYVSVYYHSSGDVPVSSRPKEPKPYLICDLNVSTYY